MKKKEKTLGRGLSSLISSEDFDELLEKPSSENITFAKIDYVYPNENQPREYFDSDALDELTMSVKQNGVISPILVRKLVENKFEIIAGERRYRAAKKAKLKTIPILIKDANDTNALELSIIENIQRQDLNIIEEAKAYQTLIDNYGHTQNDIANIIGKSRSHIANILRLLSLPAKVIEYLKNDKISMGHAKVLIGKENAEQVVDEVIKNNLNVRQTENLIAQNTVVKKPVSKLKKSTYDDDTIEKDKDLLLIESLLKEKSNLNVKIDNRKKIITISYDDLSELDGILQLLSSK
ncbi:MAG: ParB/RepB/Spo0J family partition protein [Rickettsiales bacterium]|nr:ParB/RepB/Spo0J family partition protein [Rickettsiales bacterium]